MDVQIVRCQIFSLTILSLVYVTHSAYNLKMRKICKDSIEILSNTGVRIEPYHKSHVKLALVDQLGTEDSEFRLSFEFRTLSPDGVLFYGRSKNPRELIALSLKGGDLFYKIQCPSLHADILVPTKNNSRLDDGSWHNITYKIKYRQYDTKGDIELDGFSGIKRYIVSCAALNTLIMGGYSEEDKGKIADLERLPGHFEGCIRNVFIPVPLRYPPKYYAVSVCD